MAEALLAGLAIAAVRSSGAGGAHLTRVLEHRRKGDVEPLTRQRSIFEHLQIAHLLGAKAQLILYMLTTVTTFERFEAKVSINRSLFWFTSWSSPSRKLRADTLRRCASLTGGRGITRHLRLLPATDPLLGLNVPVVRTAGDEHRKRQVTHYRRRLLEPMTGSSHSQLAAPPTEQPPSAQAASRQRPLGAPPPLPSVHRSSVVHPCVPVWQNNTAEPVSAAGVWVRASVHR